MKGLHKLVAYGKWTLRACPDSKFVTIPFRHGSSRLQRSVLNVGNGVSRFDLLVCRSKGAVKRAFLMHIGATTAFATGMLVTIRGLLAQIVAQFLFGNLLRRLPLCLDCARRSRSTRRIRRDYADEVAVVHDRYTFRVLRFTGIKGRERSVISRRTYNFSIQHARTRDVGRIFVFSRHELAAIRLRQ